MIAAAGTMTARFQSSDKMLTLAHINLDIADLTRSEAFYRDVLELPVTRRSDSLLVRWPGGLVVLELGTPAAPNSFHFGFRVETRAAVDEWFERFAQSGTPIVESPVERAGVYVGRIADPDRYPVEVYADLAAR